MNTIQLASSIYVLGMAVISLVAVAAAGGKKVSVTGFPAAIFAVAVIVCAVSTLANSWS